jgi:hypothetical protein
MDSETWETKDAPTLPEVLGEIQGAIAGKTPDTVVEYRQFLSKDV